MNRDLLIRLMIGSLFCLVICQGIIAENRLLDIEEKLLLKDFVLKETAYSQDKTGIVDDWSGTDVKPYTQGAYLGELESIKGKIISFKTNFFLGESLKQHTLSLLLYPTTHPYSIYLNGVFIYRNTRFDRDLPTESDLAHVTLLSGDLLNFGADANELVVRVYPQYYNSPLGNIMVCSIDSAQEWAFWRNLICIGLIQGSFILAFMIAFLFLMLYILFNFKQQLFLYAVLLCIFYCVANVNMTFQYYSLNSLGIEKLGRIGFPFVTIFLTLFVAEFTNVLKKSKKIFTFGLLGVGVFSMVHQLLQPNVAAVKELFGFYSTLILVPLLFVNFLLLIIMLFVKKHTIALVFLIAFAFIIVASIHDVIYFNSGTNPYMWLVPYGYLVFIICVFFFLAGQTAHDYFASIHQAQHIQKSQNVFKKFVPNEFLNILNIENILDVRLGNQIEKDMTVLFLDIRSFTSLSESLTPEETFKFINSFLSRMSPHIRRNNGFIDKYVGDGIIALFPHTADDAIRAAIAMQSELEIYNQFRKNAGYVPIDIGIGINTGHLILGIVGEEERLEGTVISDAVNVAQRIEQATKVFRTRILVSHVTFQSLDDPTLYVHRFLGQVKAKGKEETTAIFEILPKERLKLSEEDLAGLDAFNRGILAFYMKEFEAARTLFDKAVHVDHADRCARRYFELCDKFAGEGVGADWDGVERYY